MECVGYINEEMLSMMSPGEISQVLVLTVRGDSAECCDNYAPRNVTNLDS